MLTPEDDGEEIRPTKPAFKRGTRTTGAGASKRRNPSIFSSTTSKSEPPYYQQWTAAALSGDVLNRQQQQQQQQSTKSSKTKAKYNNHNPMSGRILAKQTHDGLIFRFPASSEDGSISQIKLSASPYTVLNGNEDVETSKPTIQAEHMNVIDEAGADKDDSASSPLSTSQFRSLEGIYGIFNLPCSGPHAILITASEEVYTSPKADKFPAATPLLQLRRIKSLEIVPLARNALHASQHETIAITNGDESKQQMMPTNLQLAEEARQLKLLRNSFKEHDFYFSVPNKEGIVHDISHCLQRSFIEWMGRTSQTNNASSSTGHRWWLPYVMEGGKTSPETKRRTVDPRFFWNEQSTMSLLQPLMGKTDEEDATQSPYGLLLDHVIPVTSAFVGIQRGIDIPPSNASSKVKEKYDQLLISRRSKYRTGTRFTRRGVDGSGAVANYAETEQICFILRDDGGDSDACDLKEVYSHVQTRGSIPLHWSSPADVKAYRPRVYIGVDPVVQARGLRDHLLGEMWWYSSSATRKSSVDEKIAARRRLLSKVTAASDEDTKIAMVNLIDKHGDQGRLGNSFDAVLTAVMEVYCSDKVSKIGALTRRKEQETVIGSKDIKHIWYDFHAECKGGRWDKLSSLLDQVTPTLNGQGYFSVVPKTSEEEEEDDLTDWEVKSVQDGVVRTNCMDCLDRTNVVQSMFGRYILFRQLQERKGLQVNDSGARRITRRTLPLESVIGFKKQPLTLPWLEGEMAHRCLWADNADAISNLYAGTPALKGDFTRTGKRTKRGAMNDGVNSLQRYYLNNFIDADRQEGMDLLVGSTQFNFIPSEVDRDSSRAVMLQDLSNGRRGYDKKHVRIKTKSSKENDTNKQGDNTRELELNWLPGDLRSHMKNEAQRSRSSLSLAAEEEHVDAKSSSDFLMAVSSSAANPIETLHHKLQSIDQRSYSARPWWAKTEHKLIRSILNARSGVSDIVAPALKGKKVFVTTVFLLCKAPILSAALIASLIGSGFLDEDESMD